MATFIYSARDSSGAAVSGTVQADAVGEAIQMVRADGKYPISVRPADPSGGAASAPSVRGIKISRAEVIQIITQLAIMIETGVTLAEALECVATQAERSNVKRLLLDLGQHVQGGGDFSAALARHPRSFPRLFVSLIQASEKSGMLVRMLNRGVTYLRDEQETIRRVKGALTYPGIMLAFAVTTTVFLLAFVLPRFTTIYASKAAALPTPTKVLMAMSDFIVAHYIALPVGVVVAVVGGHLFFKRTAIGRRFGHYLQLNVPLFGPMFRKMHLSRGLRMVGTMASAGVSLVDCVQTAQDLCANSYFHDLWASVAVQIQAGKQLSEPLFESPLVPRAVAQMLHSGERGGKLAQVMEQVAGYAETELKEKIAELTRYIEPAMIVVMGAIIGGVAMALLLPIFTISRVMSAG